ncbi:MAG: 5'-3' exoribonuclease [Chlamydiales bacterium]|nr:5'-3' exoribonuclease [Chlamydiales bacterium]MCH9620427.1 5'-3' exoribonuclease [Chlamydiales bacterium]MCH9622927.1 5'-3' exoribonuclease [Chlamydiales bacterium]
MFKADLHCHSFFSDGTDSPERLIELAIESGLSALSITDHDTTAAYPEALFAAKERNFLLLPGVEFSASYKGDPVHVLGYGYDIKSPHIQELCNQHQIRRRDRNLKILANLSKLGIDIELEELGSSGTIGRPHIALALQKRGFISTIREAFDLYLGEGKAAYDPGEPITVSETIDVIHQGGGKAVLAHPHLISRSNTVRHVLTLPFDGIEGYYAKMPFHREKKWIDIGKEKGWIVTGGSDYHGSVKPLNVLGSSWVGKDSFDALS